MTENAPTKVFCALTALVTAGASASPRMAEAICRVLSDPLRRLFAAFTAALPFPLFEIALLALPPLTAFAVVFSVKRGSDGSRRLLSFAGAVFSLTLLLSVIPARRSVPADPTPPGDGEMVSFALWLCDGINAEEAKLPASDGGGTPFSFGSVALMSDAVVGALRDADLCPTRPVRVKATLFPRLLRRAGLLGYHAPLTGEAVIDASAPAYTLPFTAAHEAAHQAGIVSEGEASFVAYLSLLSSSDPALRYAALMGAVDATLPLLPEQARRQIMRRLPPRVREDLHLFDRVLSNGGGAQTVAGTNAAAIRLRDGEDGRSYDLFPILACRRFLAASEGDAAASSAIY